MKLFGFEVDESVNQLFQNMQELQKDLTWTPLPSGPEVWAEGERRGEIIKEELLKKRQQSEEFSRKSWKELLELRRKASTKEEQNVIAPYEHRAYAREYVKENPEAALVMPGLILGYNTLKAVGEKEGRSDASFKTILEGMKGAIEGIGGRARELFED